VSKLRLDGDSAERIVEYAKAEFLAWSQVPPWQMSAEYTYGRREAMVQLIRDLTGKDTLDGIEI
jgi:hypothetical protein